MLKWLNKKEEIQKTLKEYKYKFTYINGATATISFDKPIHELMKQLNGNILFSSVIFMGHPEYLLNFKEALSIELIEEKELK